MPLAPAPRMRARVCARAASIARADHSIGPSGIEGVEGKELVRRVAGRLAFFFRLVAFERLSMHSLFSDGSDLPNKACGLAFVVAERDRARYPNR